VPQFSAPTEFGVTIIGVAVLSGDVSRWSEPRLGVALLVAVSVGWLLATEEPVKEMSPPAGHRCDVFPIRCDGQSKDTSKLMMEER
jgi:hypothetical protein